VAADNPATSLERTLGGGWHDHGGRRSFVVERHIDPDQRCGRLRVRDLASTFGRAIAHAPLLGLAADAMRSPFVFLDLETTGLSGGAGTHAFLVGLGRFAEDGGFVTRQYLLVAYADERTLLEAVTRDLSSAGVMVSFNGKSFDAPVLETRYLFHRLDWPGARLPHLDAIHPARRFWGGDETTTCSLGTLEHRVLGARRADDVSGFEIPGRYFRFVRSGDARPLAAVLEHNRLDLLSLAGLLARLLELVEGGPETARDGQEAFALGRVYERASLDERARESFQLALVMDAPASVRLGCLRHLAIGSRRARRFDEAAGYWQRVLDMQGCPPHVRREASEALAIHHEHRVRDLGRAKTFALKSLEMDARPAWSDAVRHRLARIERKMERADEPPLLAY
jgi:uncharacterized protein YprB with RNaseH-like and TPR domain